MVGIVLKEILENGDIAAVAFAAVVVCSLIIIIFTTVIIHVIKESGIIELIKKLNGKEKNDKGKNLKIEGLPKAQNSGSESNTNN